MLFIYLHIKRCRLELNGWLMSPCRKINYFFSTCYLGIGVADNSRTRGGVRKFYNLQHEEFYFLLWTGKEEPCSAEAWVMKCINDFTVDATTCLLLVFLLLTAFENFSEVLLLLLKFEVLTNLIVGHIVYKWIKLQRNWSHGRKLTPKIVEEKGFLTGSEVFLFTWN